MGNGEEQLQGTSHTEGTISVISRNEVERAMKRLKSRKTPVHQEWQ